MKKTHPNQYTGLESPGISETFADHPLVKWTSENGRQLLWVFAALLLVVYLLYRMTGSSLSTKDDYLNAEKQFSIFQNSVNSKEESKERQAALDLLAALLKKHPEIQAKYDGLIAQSLINIGEVKEATFFADRTLERTKIDNLSFFAEYAKTTLEINHRHENEALKQALNLKQQLLDASAKTTNNQNYLTLLYSFNLLRIAILSQQIGDKGHELAAWQEFKTVNANTNGNSLTLMTKQSFEAVKKVFQEGKTTLADYITIREAALK
jgi:hypothetical protein